MKNLILLQPYLCSTEERNSYSFGTTWGTVNDNNFLFWENYHFKCVYLNIWLLFRYNCHKIAKSKDISRGNQQTYLFVHLYVEAVGHFVVLKKEKDIINLTNTRSIRVGCFNVNSYHYLFGNHWNSSYSAEVRSVVKSTDFGTSRYWDFKNIHFPLTFEHFWADSLTPLIGHCVQQIWLWLATMFIASRSSPLFTGICQRSSMCRYIRDPLIYAAFKCSHVLLCEHRKISFFTVNSIAIYDRSYSQTKQVSTFIVTNFCDELEHVVKSAWGNFHPHPKFLIAWIPIEMGCKKKDRPCHKWQKLALSR